MAAAAAAAAMAAVIDFTEQLTTATVYSQLNPFVTAIPPSSISPVRTRPSQSTHYRTLTHTSSSCIATYITRQPDRSRIRRDGFGTVQPEGSSSERVNIVLQHVFIVANTRNALILCGQCKRNKNSKHVHTTSKKFTHHLLT